MSDITVNRRKFRRAGPKCPCGPFAVNTELKLFPIYSMPFNLGHVVGNIIDLKDVVIRYFAGQGLLETFADVEGKHPREQRLGG